MKKLLVLLAIASFGFRAFADEPVNEKLIKAFQSTFPHAQQVRWVEDANSFTVSFVEYDTRARAFYNHNGELYEVIRYYGENKVPFIVQHAMTQEFAGKKIFGVVEVSTTHSKNDVETIYYVKLVDANRWTTVKVNVYGNTMVTQRLRKV
jgi:tRNA U38,U39,U40 pseudouridine synthase TruA